MAHPSAAEAEALARDDSKEAIEAARSGGATQPIVGIADGADHHARSTGFHKQWWRQHDEDWPAEVSEAYNEAFTRELLAAKVAVVELQFDAAGGKWTNVGVVDLEQWEPTFPFDPESTGWVRQDPRSRVGWRRRSVLRKLFSRKKRGALHALALFVCLGGALAAPAAAAPTAITEYPVEVGHLSNVDHLAVGADGKLWFADGYYPEGGYHALIGRFDPSTGAIAEFDQGLGQFSVIRDFVAGPDGNMWFADSGSAGRDAAIGKITPTGQITEFATVARPWWIIGGPDGSLWFTGTRAVGHVTTAGSLTAFELPSGFGELATGPDGKVWFTYGSGATAGIGRVEEQPGESTLITIFHTGLGPHSVPERIVAAGGYLWFTDLSGAEPAIGRVSPDGTITEFREGLAADSTIIDIAAGPDGNVWFTDSGIGAIGRITPSGQITEFTDEGIGPFVYYRNEVGFPLQHLVAGPDGNMWFTIRSGSGVLGKITPAGQITVFHRGEGGLSAGVTLRELATGPHGELWFDADTEGSATSTSGQTIGRIVPGDDTKPPGEAGGASAGGGPRSPSHTLVSGPRLGLWGSSVLKAGRHGKIGLRLICANVTPTPCAGSLRLTFPPSSRVVASVAVSVVPGTTRRVSLSLDRQARRLLAGVHRQGAVLSLVGLSDTLMARTRVSVRASRPAR